MQTAKMNKFAILGNYKLMRFRMYCKILHKNGKISFYAVFCQPTIQIFGFNFLSLLEQFLDFLADCSCPDLIFYAGLLSTYELFCPFIFIIFRCPLKLLILSF